MRWGASRVQTQYFGVYQALRLDAFLVSAASPDSSGGLSSIPPGLSRSWVTGYNLSSESLIFRRLWHHGFGFVL
jgi:hypothetical protein